MATARDYVDIECETYDYYLKVTSQLAENGFRCTYVSTDKKAYEEFLEGDYLPRQRIVEARKREGFKNLVDEVIWDLRDRHVQSVKLVGVDTDGLPLEDAVAFFSKN